MTAKKFNYKKAIEEIESIIEKIENEDLDIDELSDKVKKAAKLISDCKAKLRDTGTELENVIENLND